MHKHQSVSKLVLCVYKNIKMHKHQSIDKLSPNKHSKRVAS